MGKAVSNGFLDGTLDNIATSTAQYACTAEPANFAGIAAVALADVTMSGGDFTKADGDTSGRKVTVGQKSAVAIDTAGTASHIVLTDGTDIYVTTCTSQVLTDGGTVTFPPWDIEIADPT